MHSVTFHSRKFFSIFKFLEDTSPLCGATKTPVLDFWWCLLWVSKPEWAAFFVLGEGVCYTFPRFVSGVTPADLLVASMAAELFSSTYLQTGIGEAQNQDLFFHHGDRRSSHWAMPPANGLRSVRMITVRKWSCGKVIFLHLSVILFTGRAVHPLDRHSP